jgi:hypothetical protein
VESRNADAFVDFKLFRNMTYTAPRSRTFCSTPPQEF